MHYISCSYIITGIIITGVCALCKCNRYSDAFKYLFSCISKIFCETFPPIHIHTHTHMHTHTITQLLVKKSYGDKRKRHKLRNWQLQQLDREMEATNQESYERDYTEFLEDLEEDKQFRQNVNIYFSESECV